MNRKSLGQMGFIIAVLALAFWTYRRSSDRPKIDLNPYQALGAVSAEETARLLSQSGEIVLVIPDPGDERDPVMDAQLAAYRAGLKSGKVTIRSIETIKMDPFQSMRTGGAIPPDQLVALMGKYPNIAALVLFLPFPALDHETANAFKEHSAKRIVISAAVPGYETLLEEGIIHLAIVPRLETTGQTAGQPRNPRELFDREYSILRGEP